MTPKETVTFWDIKNIKSITPANGGLINKTYFVKTAEDLLVLQKIHPIIAGSNATLNYSAVTEFLRENGFPAQILLKTKAGLLTTDDGKETWRLLRAIQGKVFEVVESAWHTYEAGKALLAFHAIMGKFKKPLERVIPAFQYAEVFKKLHAYQNKFSNKSHANSAAKFLLAAFPQCILPSNLPRRIIHADPKISNFIFDSQNHAIAMIDLDGVQKLTPLYDIGDAVRSLCGGEEDDPQNCFSQDKFRAFQRGYFKSAKNYLSKEERELIPRAAKLVMLGLAARFLNDYIDDNYFGWNKKKYNSRRAHNLARALGQIALYKSFIKTTKQEPG
ncbi:MAG: aminoglycoside phosphotransferase family protein [Candidatus Liptonbacteria bacterium]|nr:aminoglycoside phosphotransferase family protein [Candidatus Liptonbacteria bacterium]